MLRFEKTSRFMQEDVKSLFYLIDTELKNQAYEFSETLTYLPLRNLIENSLVYHDAFTRKLFNGTTRPEHSSLQPLWSSLTTVASAATIDSSRNSSLIKLCELELKLLMMLGFNSRLTYGKVWLNLLDDSINLLSEMNRVEPSKLNKIRRIFEDFKLKTFLQRVFN